MSFHSTDITLDNTFNLDQLQSMDESARDAKHLFPDLGTMDDDDFFNLKQEGDTAGELNEPMSSENLNSHLAKRAIGSDLRDTSNIVATSIIVPPVIRSNPETPNELNFSFQDIAPPMNRVGSEQSSLHGLKPQNTKLQHPMNVSLPGRLMNQDLDQLHTSKRSDKNEELESVVFSQSGTLAMPSAHCDYSQAGLDIVANFEPEARQSNLRAPVRPSKLRNSVSSMSPDSAQPLYQSGQARPQNKRTIFEATAFDQGTAIRGRRHTDADLFPYSYHIPETNPYLADQDLTNNGAADLSNFAYPSRYPSPHSYSHPYGAQSPYIHRGVHEDLAHEKVSSHRRRDDLLFQQPAAHLSNTSPSQPSSFAQPHFTIMKQEDSSPESGAQSMVYQPLGSNSTATEIDTYRSNRAADAAPRYNEQDKPFFEQIFAAMMDTSKAVDSKAIIGTWKNASADREAVAGVARDLVVCTNLQLSYR